MINKNKMNKSGSSISCSRISGISEIKNECKLKQIIKIPIQIPLIFYNDYKKAYKFLSKYDNGYSELSFSIRSKSKL